MLLEQLELIHLFEAAPHLENGPGTGLAWAEHQSSCRTLHMVNGHKSLGAEGYKPHFSDQENVAQKDDLLKVTS